MVNKTFIGGDKYITEAVVNFSRSLRDSILMIDTYDRFGKDIHVIIERSTLSKREGNTAKCGITVKSKTNDMLLLSVFSTTRNREATVEIKAVSYSPKYLDSQIVKFFKYLISNERNKG